jgi:hypothetical protein
VVQEPLAINGNQAQMGSTGWANATGTGSTTATFTPPSTVGRYNLLQGLVNAAINGCDQAVSNNAVAVISRRSLVTTQPTDVMNVLVEQIQ